MALRYTATIYSGDEEIAHQEGDDIDDLYTWMLAKTTDAFGDINGEVVDNETGETVRCFRKAPTD